MIHRGFKDRLSAYQEADRQDNAPKSKPVDKSMTAPSTSTTVNKDSRAPAAKLKPKGGTYKAPKPQSAKGPKEAQIKPDEASAQPSAEEMLRSRTSEMRNRLSAISMASSGVGGAKPSPSFVGPKSQSAKESVTDFLHGILQEARWPNEEKMGKKLGSSANVSMRVGTPVKHTFVSNDRKHTYKGRELSMRQKIMAEHKRKKFDLHPNFPNMAPQEIGSYFDELSDQGMLEPRKNLDDSRINRYLRKATRIGGRVKRSVVSFYKSLTQKKTKESDDSFCQFMAGNVKYPSDCGCKECAEMFGAALNEAAGSSFGNYMRGDIQEVTNQDSGKETVIARLLKLRKRKKRTVREAYEDYHTRSEQDKIRMMAREMSLHSRQPRVTPMRDRGYFGTAAKLDRLGMTLATLATIRSGVSPKVSAEVHRITQNLRAPLNAIDKSADFAFSKAFQQAAPLARKGAAALKALFGVRESDTDSLFDNIGKHRNPKSHLHAFFDSPVGYVRSKLKSMAIGAAERVGVPHKYRYPVGVMGGLAATAGSAYVGKRYLYDPLKKKISDLHSKVEELRARKST